jgi:hypothetical protein
MVAKRALSTDFWSSTRSFAVSFFCRGGQYDTCENVVTCTYLGLLALLEERVLTRLVGGLVLGEVTVLANLIQNLGVDTLQVDRGGGCDDIAGVDPSQRNAVYFEWAGDEEDTLGKVLEENDTLAAETTGEEDHDGTGSKRCSGFRRACSFTGLESQLAVLWTLQFQPSALHLLCSLPQSHRRCASMAHLVLLLWCIGRAAHWRTYLLGDGDVLSRVVLARLLGLLFLFVGRHFELWLSSIALGVR